MIKRKSALFALLFVFFLTVSLTVGILTSPAYAGPDPCCKPTDPGSGGNFGHWVVVGSVCDCTPNGSSCTHLCAR